MIAEPLLADAVHATCAEAFAADATTALGAEGAEGACGVTVLLGNENADAPCAFAAETSNWYDVPFVRPVSVMLVGTTDVPEAAVTTTSGIVTPDDEKLLRTV